MPRPMKPLRPVCQTCKQVIPPRLVQTGLHVTKRAVPCAHGRLLCPACCAAECRAAVPA